MIKKEWKSQKGLSLIELMIAMTLSLIVAAAMIALFISSRQSYRVNENMSRLQENARFAVAFISRDLRMADYRPCVREEERLADAISGENNTGLNGSDTITIRWQSDDDDDCATASSVVTTIYSIQTGSGGNPALFRSINGNSQELVEGIENLQFLFGEDLDDDNVPNYYVEASDIADMAQAISTRFSVIARTLDTNITTSGNRITRDFTSTITLRNRLP